MLCRLIIHKLRDQRENEEENKRGWIQKVIGWVKELVTVGRKMHSVCNILQSGRQSRDLYIPGTV